MVVKSVLGVKGVVDLYRLFFTYMIISLLDYGRHRTQ